LAVEDRIGGLRRRDIPGPLRELVREQHGMVARRQALATGLTPAMIKHRIQSERWVQVYAGVYSVFTGPPTDEALRWAAVLWGGSGAVLSHGSAAAIHGLADAPPDSQHVSVPLTRRVRDVPGVTIHLSKHVAGLRFPPGTLPVTSADETVLDLTQAAQSLEEADGWVSRALGRGVTTPEKLRSALAARKKVRWRRELDDLVVAAANQ
jgi:predicted transcriptional regulator of viral defense system